MAIITISGGAFSGGKELAEFLSNRLGYRLVYQEELLPTEAAELGVPPDEPETGLMEKYGLLEGPNLRRIFYVAYMQVAICEEARTDDVVFHGQAAHLLLKGIPHHLGVRVIAGMDHRIQNAMKQRRLSRRKAVAFIRHRDAERDKWVRVLYGADRNDPADYDMVINATRIDIEDAGEMVVDTVSSELRTTAESQAAIGDLILAAEIRARIALDRGIVYDYLEIEVHDRVVTLTGRLRSSEDGDRIRALVRQQPGVRDIESRTATRW